MEIVTEPVIRSAEAARRYAEELRLLLLTIGASDARHGERPDARRGERLAAAARHRGVRHAGRGQEHELVPLGRARRSPTRSSARPRRSTRASRSSRRRAAGTTTARRPTRCAQGGVRTTTATSPSPTCRRCDRRGMARRGSASGCPSCRRPGGRATATALGLSAYDAGVIVGDPAPPRCSRRSSSAHRATPARRANWVTGEYLGRLKRAGPGRARRSRGAGDARRAVESGELSRTNASEVFEQAIETGESAASIVAEPACARSATPARSARRSTRCSRRTPTAVADFRAGKAQAIGFLAGQVMKATRGQANAALVQAALRERLDGRGGLTRVARQPRAVGPRRRRCSRSATAARGGRTSATRRSKRRTRTSRATSVARRRARHVDRRARGGDADPAAPGADRRRDRDRRHRVRGRGLRDPLTAAAAGRATGYPPIRSRRCSIAVQRSITTPGPRRGDPGGLPVDDAELEPERLGAGRRPPPGDPGRVSGRRKTSTRSNGPVATAAASPATGTAATPWTDVANGLTGTHLVALAEQVRMTPCDGRYGSRRRADHRDAARRAEQRERGLVVEQRHRPAALLGVEDRRAPSRRSAARRGRR